MLPVERAALKLVPGQVYNSESLFQHCTLVVEHDKRSDRGFFCSGGSTDAISCFTTHRRPDYIMLGCNDPSGSFV